MSAQLETSQGSNELKRNAIGWFSVFFMVITTNGPLTAMAGGVPVSIALGNGIGLPGSYAIVSLVYLIFGIGFCAMSRYMRNSGAFYAYITQGLGPTTGISAGAMAVYAYNGVLLACYGMLGHFLQVAISDWFGVDIAWWVYCAVFAVICHVLCVRGIEFSGRVLATMMIFEVGVIVLCDFLSLGGMTHVSVEPFKPSVVFSSGFGPSLIFVVASFMGFETAAIYSQEVRDAERSVPKAMYASIIFIGVLYTASIWLMIEYYGYDKALSLAAKDPGSMWFTMFGNLAGRSAEKIATLLVINSLFAAVLSFTNVIARYWHVLGSVEVVSRRLSVTHPVHGSPVNASSIHLFITLALIAFCRYENMDPMLEVLPLASTPAAIGVVTVQCLAAISVIGFFRREAHAAVGTWRSVVCPAISAVAMGYFIYQMILHVDLLSGRTDLATYALALSVLAVGIVGAGYALYLKRFHKAKFAALSDAVVKT